MAVGVFQATPPRLPISVATPFSQRTAWRALKRPTATSQIPEMPLEKRDRRSHREHRSLPSRLFGRDYLQPSRSCCNRQEMAAAASSRHLSNEIHCMFFWLEHRKRRTASRKMPRPTDCRPPCQRCQPATQHYSSPAMRWRCWLLQECPAEL